ncbi:RIIB lysis inhibitor [Vibrio phage PWH3a-P1]|uniref:RIIB lysis inhibitor n=1 Tax=Vibrio phage PWH3a-P1 TaxID=754058 RepID=UPI0002C0FFA7|nr:RIIB lysis inhibitor [Vibrio phage PWH3a-P1]AGH31944.1 rIIB [Vibrio phage PWH3a-P1]
MKRTNIVKILSEGQKWDIYTNYLEGNHKTKKALAKDYGISTRTLGRIISEMESVPTPEIKSFEYDYTVTKNQITIFCNDESRSVDKGYPKFKSLRKKLIEQDFNDSVLREVYDLLNLPKFVETFSEGNITVKHETGQVFYGTFEIKNSVVDRMMDMLSEKEDVKPLVKFLERLMMNPKENVIEELYPFLRHNDIEISDEGYIIAYRSIRRDWKDFHTGIMDNSVGKVVSMPRSLVDANPNVTCSTGIHCAAYEYASDFGGSDYRLIRVKVCPSDVVSVPVDYCGQKMRVCKLEVIEEVV